MNADTLDPLGLMNQTVEELQVLRLAVADSYEKYKDDFHLSAIHKVWAERINEAIKDIEFQSKQLPFEV